MRLVWKFVLTYAGSALLIGVVAVLSAHFSHSALRATIGESSVKLVDETADHIDRYLFMRIEEIQRHAREPALRETLRQSNADFSTRADPAGIIASRDQEWLAAAWDTLTPLMREVMENPVADSFRRRMGFYRDKYGRDVFSEIFVTNRYGANVAQSGRTSDYLQSDEDWWQISHAKGAYVGDVAFDPSAGVYSVEMAARVDDEDGSFLGVMKAVLNIEDVIDIVREMESGRGRQEERERWFHLVTHDGHIIYSTDPFEIMSLRPDFAAMGPSGYVERATAAHGEVIMAWAQSRGYRDFPGLKWVLIVERPSRDVFAPIRELKRRLALWSLFFAGLSVVLGWSVAAAITRPIARLRQGTEIIASGDLDHRVSIASADEIGDLSRAFDRMAARLRQITVSRDDLAREVEERQRAELRLKEALAELERSNRDLEQFAYIASHDLREPLRKVKNFTELFAQRYQDQVDEKAGRYIAYVVDGAIRMERLIDDLLAFARVGRQELAISPTDLNQTVETVLGDLETRIAETRAEVRVDDLPILDVSPRHVALVFQNLLANALKFHGDQPPRIHVSAERQGDHWVFSVRDNGIGIDPKYHDRLFKIFSRLHESDQYPGNGIGLAVCRRIVERHGGRIWVESEAGQGACFRFILPAKQPKEHVP